MKTALKTLGLVIALSLGSPAFARSAQERQRQVNHVPDEDQGKDSVLTPPVKEEVTSPPGVAKMTNQTTRSTTATFFEKERVDAGFAKGIVLFDSSDKYQVHASRREKAGVVEIHEKDADIMYFISGTATLVTGGEAINPSATGPDEIRATDIKGGEVRQVKGGDVIVIPAGTPHWFKEVPGPLTYFTVKAR